MKAAFNDAVMPRFRRYAALTAFMSMALLLSGCLYPKDEQASRSLPPKEAVRNVQAAIDHYYEDNRLLPILNSDAAVPKYEKFRLDFQKLQRSGYISAIPAAAFENGGNYYFIVIDEETEPRIKLMDIVTFQRVNDIQNWVRSHVQGGGELPVKDEMYPGFYSIDYTAMNRTAPVIRSVFSGQTLSAIIDESGAVFTDYGIDIMQLLQRSDLSAIAEDDDLRALLVDSSDYVPVKSPQYRLVNGEPVAIAP